MKFKFLIICLLQFSSVSFSKNVELWNFFEKGDYQQIISHFDGIDRNQISSSEYNLLGNSFFRVGDLEKATFAYFLGLKKDPFSSELRHNLRIVASGDYGEHQRKTQINFISVIFLIFILLALTTLFFLRPSMRRKNVVSFLFLLSFTGLIIFQKREVNLNNYLFVEKNTELRSGIDPNALVYEKLSKGKILIVEERVGSFVKVFNLDGESIGWIKK